MIFRLRNALAAALDDADLILVSGGSSVGVRDLTLTAIQDLPGAEILVHGVAIRPGKPTILAGVGETGPSPSWGCRGTRPPPPWSWTSWGDPCWQLSGLTGPPPWGRAVTASLSRNLAGATGREDYVRVRLRREADTLWADPVLGPSGLMSPLVKSDGLVMIPLGVEGLVKGETVKVRLFG